MRRWFIFTASALALTLGAGLLPETVSTSFERPAGDAYADTNTFLSGTSLLFTNCQTLVSSGVTQDLTDVFVVLRVGNDRTNYTFSAGVDNATNGLFYGTVEIPTHAQLGIPVQLETTVRVQCTLTNAAGAVFTYRGAKLLKVRSGLTY